MSRQRPIIDPNDPRFKLQNELRIIVEILEIIGEDTKRHLWIQQAQQEAALQALLKRKRELDTAIGYEERTPKTPRNLTTETTPAKTVEVKDTLKVDLSTIINNAANQAMTAAQQIQNVAAQAKAQHIIQQTFTTTLPHQAAQLASQVTQGAVQLDQLLAQTHPHMHQQIQTHFTALQQATAAGNMNAAMNHAIQLQTTVNYGTAMQEQLKREVIIVPVVEATVAQRSSVETIDANTMRLNPEAVHVGYRDNEGQFREIEAQSDSELRRFVAENAEVEGDLGLRTLFGEEALIDPERFDPETWDDAKRKTFHELLDAVVKKMGAESVGERLEAQADVLQKFHTDTVRAITEEVAKQTTSAVTSAYASPPTPKPQFSTSTKKDDKEKDANAQQQPAASNGVITKADGNTHTNDGSEPEPMANKPKI